MSLKIGIVGLPNVGKSTIFKAITKKQVSAENYPFCTILPNVGVVEVPDKRVEKLAKISQSAKKIHSTVEFVDIAGLVEGAHSGKGLGNKFLSHIREVDAIVHVIRSFEDKNIFHTQGSVDVRRDFDIINIELIYADLQMTEKVISKVEKEARAQNKEAQFKLKTLEKIKENLENEKSLREAQLNEEEKNAIKEYNFLTTKPVICLKNTNKELSSLEKSDNFLEINALLELELSQLEKTEQEEYKKESNISMCGLDNLIVESYRALNLISFITTGKEETKAWTVEKGSTAPVAAGKIHTDFQKKFIKAEVVSVDDFITHNGWTGAREKGVIKEKGKEYVVDDGDVIYFKVGA